MLKLLIYTAEVSMCNKCRLVKLSINMDDLEPELRRIAKLLYEGKLKPGQIDAAMVKRIAEQLMKAISKGFTSSTPEAVSFVKKLEENIYVFSGFKNYQQLKETSMLLFDNEGSYKSFNEFLNDVKQINATYNEVYLEAEYNNALASAQNAQTWQDFQAAGIDTLEFQTAGDERVRDEHVILNGLIVSIDDPLLDTYFTPLDWGCRCEWIPAIGEKPTGYSQSDLPTIPPMFQNNVGKTGIVFPDTHPYFDVSQEIKQTVMDQVADIKPAADPVADALTDDVPEFTPALIGDYEKRLGITVDKQIFSYLSKETPLITKGKGAAYLPDTNEVRIPIDARRKKSKWYSEAVVYHEYGHAADWQNNLKDLPAVKSLMAKYKEKYADKFRKLSAELYAAASEYQMADKFDLSEQVSAVADTIHVNK